MIKIKPQNPGGVRDFLPEENRKREYIISIIKKHYERFGFQGIYTPSFERLETLQGKYGDEGDQLLFKILKSGEYIKSETKELIQNSPIAYGKLTSMLAEKGLRYDLTVPLARFVSQHQNELIFPFKRYHIAPVWRADRPQKGRYQEFFQCDADIVGTKSLVADVELINLINDVFSELNLKVDIKINNRKIYNGICQICSIENQSTRVSTILDKLDKIGEQKVKEELIDLIGEEQVLALLSWMSAKNITDLKSKYQSFNVSNQQMEEGISEMEYIFQYTKGENLIFDLNLLRGLDYYTGTVLEAKSSEMDFGSILGGGRYDNLTEIFGMKDVSGIGISFGLDRIFDIMKELNRFPQNLDAPKTLVLNLTDRATEYYYSVLKVVRNSEKTIDLYPSVAKMDKQLSYADKAGYNYAILIGEDEMNQNTMQVKKLKLREQIQVQSMEELISILQ